MSRSIAITGSEVFFDGDDIIVSKTDMKGNFTYINVTSGRDTSEKTIGHHSNRRVPVRRILDDMIIPLYKNLKAAGQKPRNCKQGLQNLQSMFSAFLAERSLAYDEFVITLGQGPRRGYS